MTFKQRKALEIRKRRRHLQNRTTRRLIAIQTKRETCEPSVMTRLVFVDGEVKAIGPKISQREFVMSQMKSASSSKEYCQSCAKFSGWCTIIFLLLFAVSLGVVYSAGVGIFTVGASILAGVLLFKALSRHLRDLLHRHHYGKQESFLKLRLNQIEKAAA